MLTNVGQDVMEEDDIAELKLDEENIKKEARTRPCPPSTSHSSFRVYRIVVGRAHLKFSLHCGMI